MLTKQIFSLGCNNVHIPSTLKLLTRFRMSLSHLHAHKFNHKFSNFLEELRIWICGSPAYRIYLSFLPPVLIILFSERQIPLEKICNVEISVLDQKENCFCYKLLLLGTDKLNDIKISHTYGGREVPRKHFFDKKSF